MELIQKYCHWLKYLWNWTKIVYDFKVSSICQCNKCVSRKLDNLQSQRESDRLSVHCRFLPSPSDIILVPNLFKETFRFRAFSSPFSCQYPSLIFEDSSKSPLHLLLNSVQSIRFGTLEGCWNKGNRSYSNGYPGISKNTWKLQGFNIFQILQPFLTTTIHMTFPDERITRILVAIKSDVSCFICWYFQF